jgi:hypothetical protein
MVFVSIVKQNFKVLQLKHCIEQERRKKLKRQNSAIFDISKLCFCHCFSLVVVCLVG